MAKDSDQIILLDWVKNLHQNGKILHAADPCLNGFFDAEEMERVLTLGLFCSRPQPEERLGVRRVVQILEGQAPLPSDQSLSISYDASCLDDAATAFVHITDEEVATDQLISFGATTYSTSRPNTSTSDGFGIDSDYDVGR